MTVGQVIHCNTRDERGDSRRDAIEYKQNEIPHFGILQAIMHHTQFTEIIVLVGRMVQADPEPGNVKVVELFGRKRFKYDLKSSGHVRADVIPLGDV